MEMKEYSYFPKLQEWKHIIRLFCIISRTLFEGQSYSSATMLSVNSTVPVNWTKFFAFFLNVIAYQLGDLLNFEAILVEELQWFYLAVSCRDKEFHAFTKCIRKWIELHVWFLNSFTWRPYSSTLAMTPWSLPFRNV